MDYDELLRVLLQNGFSRGGLYPEPEQRATSDVMALYAVMS